MVEKCINVLVVLFWIEEVICQEILRDLYAHSAGHWSWLHHGNYTLQRIVWQRYRILLC